MLRLGLEILEDLPDVDAVVAGFGGGGLSCGIASALKERGSKAKVFAAEPERAAPFAYSLALRLAAIFSQTGKPALSMAAAANRVFPHMWDIAHHLLAGACWFVSLEEARRGDEDCRSERNHVTAEGAGALSLSPLGLSGKCGSGKVVCVVSGGNIDLSVFSLSSSP